MKTTIIINEQHTLLPDQEKILSEKFKTWDTLLVPASGWNKKKIEEIARNFVGNVVFISPIPYMIKITAMSAALNWSYEACKGDYSYAPSGDSLINCCLVMCNDTRIKKEIPGGKIISVTAKTGWYLA